MINLLLFIFKFQRRIFPYALSIFTNEQLWHGYHHLFVHIRSLQLTQHLIHTHVISLSQFIFSIRYRVVSQQQQTNKFITKLLPKSLTMKNQQTNN